ncbi:AI-2E family transporter [Xanthocytophaga flava]|uniref:AI-2E family transporter n=1 Tax=Xanthocytophaga flava TaxID=3048013 RepID=UPI0028D144D1|nr:AI-2E family transporter [Xanthocytophaga flavus]MDJ1472775.1 AI-2E family transporter [Xanthocytophaga flavus]
MENPRAVQLPIYAKITFILISIALLWIFLVQMAGMLIPICFSLLFALLLHPLCVRLETWRVPRVLAITLCLILLVIVVVGILMGIVVQLTDFADILPDLQKKFLKLFNDAQIWVRTEFGVRKKEQADWLEKNAQMLTDSSGQIVGNLLSVVSNAFTNLGLVPVYIFFLLYYRNFLRKFLDRLFSSASETHILYILIKVRDVVRNYLVGLVFVMSIIATLNTLGLLILGIQHALFFGILAALLNVIPYIGIVIGSILPILMAILTKDSLWYAVGVSAVFTVVQFLEGNFITPRIVGSKVSVNSLATVIALIMGGLLWGAPGMILAIPFTAMFKVVFDNIPGMEAWGFLLGEVPEEHLKVQTVIVEAVEAVKEEVEEIVEDVKEVVSPDPKKDTK